VWYFYVQYHELRVTFDFEDLNNIPGINASEGMEATLWADYVFLDQEERKKFASQPSEYLIEQVQFTGDESVTVTGSRNASTQIRLSMNHPTKALYFVACDPSVHGKFAAGAAGVTAEALAPLHSAKLLLNGHDRTDTRIGAVYNRVYPYQANKAFPDAGVYMMNFSLSPTQHSPSGSLNLSRIDSAVLALTFKQADEDGSATDIANVTDPESHTITDATNLSALRVYGVNFNVLRIMSGMGGLSYS